MATTYFESANNILKNIQTSLVNVIPSPSFIFANQIKFEESKKLGNNYVFDVEANYEQAVTPGGSARRASTLYSPNAGRIDQATVPSYRAVNRAIIATAMLDASKTEKTSFDSVIRNRPKSVVMGLAKHNEIDFFYGQTRKGLSHAGTAIANATQVSASGTWYAATVTLDNDDYAIGMYAGMSGARLEFWKAGAQIGGASQAYLRTITFKNGSTAGSVVVEFESQTDRDAVVTAATSVEIWFLGERTGAAAYDEMIGLNGIVTNTTTLFGVDTTVNELFRGNTIDWSALTNRKLNLAGLLAAVATPMALGLEGKTVQVHIPQVSMAGLVNDEAALKRYNGNERKGQRGFNTLEFFYNNTSFEIVVNNIVKEGHVFGFVKEECHRVGTHDVQLESATYDGKDNFLYRASGDIDGYEVRASSDQQVYLERPATSFRIAGVAPLGTAWTGA